jgi:hypothetical protein
MYRLYSIAVVQKKKKRCIAGSHHIENNSPNSIHLYDPVHLFGIRQSRHVKYNHAFLFLFWGNDHASHGCTEKHIRIWMEVK